MGLSITEVVVVVILLLVFAGLLWSVPKRQVRTLGDLPPQERLKMENETRKIMAEILGGACILIGLVSSWATIKGTVENLRISQEGLRVAQDNLSTAQEGQNTEQFTRAIEQLGKVDEVKKESNLAIRLGGIRGLERLADVSSKDYWPIMEILTTYIREKARWRVDKNRMALAEDELKPDIQAILGVLGNRSSSYGKGEDRILILTGVDLRTANLEMFNFNGADFSLAHLEKARLKRILLRLAILTGAYLNGANLEEAQLEGANLRAANLSEANLTGAVFKDAKMNAADLSGANLTGAVFKDAKMDEVDFKGALLNNADLTGVNLKSARNLTREQIRSAKTDGTTQLPEGL